MAKFLKHIGKNKSGSNVIVVFRELPDDPEHCLVVQISSLSDFWHDNLTKTVEGRQAQETVDLYEVLQRTSFGDGTQMLNGLHQRGLLRKVSVDDIEMQPMPNRLVSLRTVNEAIREGKGEQVMPTPAPEVDAPKVDNPVVLDTDPSVSKQADVGTEEQQKSLAESKLLQARLMEEDAKALREEAYGLDPDLKKGGRPSKKQQKKVAKAQAKAKAED